VLGLAFVKAYDHLGPRTHFTPTELAEQERNAREHPGVGHDPTAANEASTSEHLASLRDGGRTVLHHPWGFGIGNSGVTAARTHVKIEAGESTYTELAVETGLLGGLVFVAWSLAALVRLRRVPWLAAAFVIVTLSSIGLPGTNGFVGEFLILSGTWLGRLRHATWFSAIAATGVILGAVYMLLLVERVFFGKSENPANAALPDLSLREWTVLAPILALIAVMGLVPQPFLEPAKGSVDRLLARFQATEQRLQQKEPGYVPATGTQPPALATAPRIQQER
jgi:hypothetical protein